MTHGLVVLRPEPGNAATCDRIRAAGHEAIALPLFEVVALDWTAPDPAAFDALILTSANAVRMSGAGLDRLKSLPVHAVGDATARAADAAGLAVAAIGTDNADALIAAAAARGIARALHLGGRETGVAVGGIVAASIVVYASYPVEIDAARLTQLAGSTALLHSPRAARQLAELVDRHGLDRAQIALAAISPAVAHAAGTGWARIAVAAQPTDAALIAAAVDPPPRHADKTVMTDDMPYAPARSRTGMRTIALIVLIAFAAGIGATALFVRQYRQWLPSATPVSVASTAPTAAAPSAAFMPPPEVGLVAPSADDRVAAMRIATLSAQLAALEARTTAVDRDSRMAAGNAGRAEAMLTVFAARRALDRGLALGYVEGLLRTRFGASQPREVAALLTAGQTPVTVADLRLGLDAIAPDLATGTTKDGWWAGLQRELAGLIVLHRDNSPSPRPADRLARARQSLDAGQVEAALLEVSRLPGAASATAWTGAARRYIDARRALDTLESAALVGPLASVPAPAQPIPAPR